MSLVHDDSTNFYQTDHVGPDELCMADSLYSDSLSKAVLLRSKSVDQAKFPSMSIYTMLKQTVDARPNQNAIAYKSNEIWYYFTYLEYWKMCMKAAKSFIKLGLGPSECVSIMGFNCPEWFISCLGVIFCGGVSNGIYTTNSVDACEHVLKDCKSPVVVVENKTQLDKILACIERGQVNVKAIVQYSGQIENNHDGLVKTWQEFIEFGNDVTENELDQRIKGIAPNKCSTLIYTSGTTGFPKGAMLSHDSMTYLTRNIATEVTRLHRFDERFVSYLPLSHIAAQSVDIYCSCYLGGTTYFAQPDALKGSLSVTLKEVQPTFFFAVPRVLEKIQDKIQGTITSLTGPKASLVSWARRVSYAYIISKFKGENKCNVSYNLAYRLVLRSIHQKMGLEKCRTILSAAAPISKDTLDFFISLGLPLCECYGMSETTGPHSVGVPWLNRVASVGSVDMFNRSKVINKDDDNSGELCIYGRHVFMGYLNNPNKTEETFDEEDWLRTGDIANIDCDGFVFITGRLKELIITAGGENIPPIPIEDRIKSELGHILSNCILIGDKRKYLLVLVTLKSKVDPDTLIPLDDLAPSFIEWLRSVDCQASTVSGIIANKESVVYKAIDDGIKKANLYSTSNAMKVQKFEILPEDFSLPNGELGPTLKLRRPNVVKKYADLIEKIYAGDA